MQQITGSDNQNKDQPKPDLLAMTEADRAALTEQIRTCLQQRVREAKLKQSANAGFEQ